MPQPNSPKIRGLRQEHGWKLSDLASKAGVKYQHLANIESGHATASIEVLQRIAQALGVDRADLVA